MWPHQPKRGLPFKPLRLILVWVNPRRQIKHTPMISEQKSGLNELTQGCGKPESVRLRIKKKPKGGLGSTLTLTEDTLKIN